MMLAQARQSPFSHRTAQERPLRVRARHRMKLATPQTKNELAYAYAQLEIDTRKSDHKYTSKVPNTVAFIITL
jgi:hypothetical protein